MIGLEDRTLLALLVLAVTVGGGPVVGQEPRLQLDLSASRIRYDTLSTLDAPSAVGLMEWQTPSVLGRVSGGLTGFRGSGWSAQGRGDLAGWLAPLESSSAFRLELSGAASGSRHSSGFEALLARMDARAHFAARAAGAYGGVGWAAAKSSFDTEAVKAVVPAIGVWGQAGGIRATAQYLHTRVGDIAYPEASAVLVSTRGPMDVTVFGGLRRSSLDTSAFDDEWLGASLTYWFDPRAAVVFGGGRYPSDVLQGLPGGDFFSVGLRLTGRRNRPIPAMAEAPLVYSAAAVRDEGITLRVPGAQRVEIAGDWNGWQLVELERVGADRWRVPTRLEPGVYRFNLKVDGERWTVPEGVPEVDGGYGDRVGLLIISDGS